MTAVMTGTGAGRPGLVTEAVTDVDVVVARATVALDAAADGGTVADTAIGGVTVAPEAEVVVAGPTPPVTDCLGMF